MPAHGSYSHVSYFGRLLTYLRETTTLARVRRTEFSGTLVEITRQRVPEHRSDHLALDQRSPAVDGHHAETS